MRSARSDEGIPTVRIAEDVEVARTGDGVAAIAVGGVQGDVAAAVGYAVEPVEGDSGVSGAGRHLVYQGPGAADQCPFGDGPVGEAGAVIGPMYIVLTPAGAPEPPRCVK